MVFLSLPAHAQDKPDFHTQVQPILSEHCYPCHNAEKRKGGLILETHEGIQEGGDSGKTILAPGTPDTSFLFERINDPDPGKRMPPTGDPLSPEQIATLQSWITSGADLGAPVTVTQKKSDWWSFQKPFQAPLPQVKQSDWPRNPIDTFLLADMEAAGFAPSPPADRYTLLRRVYLDLTGLLPMPDIINTFVHDSAPDAYERVVEELLASPHYGEKQALAWLDAARYADTNGYEKDRHRSVWPYRDWVINAFNNDLPFDQFAIEQIAGDLLPNATQDQKIATGFLRNSLHNEEGGIDAEEFRYEAMVDRTNTVSTVFLGMTLACAQCHTHKYDPITQREYFEFMAFMDNTDDIVMEVKDGKIESKRAEVEKRIEAAKRRLPEEFPLPEDFKEGDDEKAARRVHLIEKSQAWTKEKLDKAVPWTILDPISWQTKNYTTLEKQPDRSLLAQGTWANTDTYTIEYRCDTRNITAIRIETLPDPSLPGGGPGRGTIMSPDGNFILSETALSAADWYGSESQVVTLQNPSVDYTEEGRSAAATLDGKLDTGWGVKDKIAQPHAIVYELAQPLDCANGARLTLKLDQYYVHQHTLGRFRVSVTSDPTPIIASGLPADLEDSLLDVTDTWYYAINFDVHRYNERDFIAENMFPKIEIPKIVDFYLSVAPEFAEEYKKIAELEASKPQYPTTLTLSERAEFRNTLLRHRGEFLKPRETVGAEVPAVLHSFPEHTPRNRLSFAQWLTSQDNPLIARVTVNRIWQDIFGQGIVPTSDDFGIQGEKPTHPQLLDWLAVEFMRRGWSTKEIVRMIVLSSTYRQSSAFTPELLERDPQNEFLARMPRFRIKAELVRDVALSASNLLTPEIGGPSVYPPVPENLLALLYSQGTDVWPESKDVQRYRRGLYVYAKRMLPFPSGLVFDQPARDTTCVRRTRSNTPLQALTLLNDTAYMESARALADRILEEAGTSFPEQIEYAFLITLSRPPDQFEIDRFRAYYETQLTHFIQGVDQTGALLQAKEEPPDPDSASRAAWVAVARILLNLDETITKE